MKLVSVNTSTPQTITFNGKALETGIFKGAVDGEIPVSKFGLAGDTIVDSSVHGGLDQAVYIYHAEDYDWWTQQLGRSLEPGTFGENLTIAGMPDTPWTIGDRLMINDLVLEISAPRAPCFKLGVRMGDNGFVKQFINACRPGAYARVIEEGVIRQGDTITVEKTPNDFSTVTEVYEVWHSKNKPLAVLKKALDSPLATVHRQRIQAWYEAGLDRANA